MPNLCLTPILLELCFDNPICDYIEIRISGLLSAFSSLSVCDRAVHLARAVSFKAPVLEDIPGKEEDSCVHRLKVRRYAVRQFIDPVD